MPKVDDSFIESSIRVNHAGEYGAVCIYHGQYFVFKHKKSINSDKILRMKKQEQEHYDYFNKLLIQKKVRPTIFMPIWHVMGVALGFTSALISEKAAMACTVAVEEVISNHYSEQIERIPSGELKDKIIKFREEELEHHEDALANAAEEAFAYDSLVCTIKGVCKFAIKLSKWL